MKRRMTLTLILTALVCLLLSVSASAATVASGTCGADGDNLTWVLDDQGTLTISGSGAMWSYNGNASYPWFAYRSDITHITIGDSVTAIGNHAFYSCDALKSVVIGDSVTTIGDRAFTDCDALESVVIGNSVTTIGYEMFYSCNALESVVIGNSVTLIGNYAFSYCNALESVVIGDSVTTIGNYAFYCCYALMDITIPDRVTSIGENAFYYCMSLESVTIGNGVRFIGKSAFAGCEALTAVTIPDSVVSIDNYAFNSCSALQSVMIGDSVETIGDSAFSHCYTLKSVTIGKSVSSIKYGAFEQCTALKSITIPESVSKIGERAFYDCRFTTVIFLGRAPTIGNRAFFPSSATVFYPPGDSSWTESVRQNCGTLLTWMQPAYGTLDSGLVWELETDGTLTFYGAGAIPDYSSSARAPWCSYDRCIREVIIPYGITTIGRYAFAYCDNLQAVTIPDSVTTIDHHAFFDCDALQSITIPDSVTTIGTATFYSCGDLKSVFIGNSLKTIGRQAFSECDSLMTVTLGNGVKTIDFKAFAYCNSLVSVAIPKAVTFIGANAFYDCTSLKTVIFTGSAPTFDTNPFGNVAAFAFYPSGDTTWTETVRQTVGGQLTWSSVASPGFLHHPVDTTKYVGDTAEFSVTAAGDNLHYQWQFKPTSATGWSNSSNGKTDTLTVPVVAYRDGYQYRCIITDKNGKKATSNVATLSVAHEVAITQQPVSFMGSVGDIATFTVVAQGVDLTYQWQQCTSETAGWTNVAGEGNALTVPLTAARNGHQYRCIVMDKRGDTVTSDAATLAIRVPLTIISQPVSTTTFEGDTAKFTVVAAGNNLTYQWQYKTSTGTGWNNSSNGNTDTLTVEATTRRNGYQYRCKVTDLAGETIITNAVTLTVKPTLSITGQPDDITATEGDTAIFTVTATGSSIKYQWQYKAAGSSGWSNSSGGKTATFSVEALAYRDGYQYRCKITDGNGNTVTTNAVTLTVKPALSITKQPVSTTLTTGNTATFKITAQGDGLTYKWQYKSPSATAWSNSSNGKTDTLNIEALAYRNGYQYRCIVTDADGKQLISNAVTLTVKPALIITKQPTSATVTTGNTAKFTVTASGSGISYQWQYKSTGSSGWSNSSSGKTASFSVEALSYRNGYQYRCKITDGTTTIYSDAVTLTVKPALSITQQPVGTTASVGEKAAFTVSAKGESVTYQWQYKSTGSSGWSNSSNGKTNTLTVEALTYRDGYRYRCKITDADGTVIYSDVATLTVRPAPAITKQPKSATKAEKERATFSVEASGDGLTYQWQCQYVSEWGWEDIVVAGNGSHAGNGYNTANLSVYATSGKTGCLFRCVITDKYGNSVTSESAELTVYKLPTIIHQPGDCSVASGDAARFIVQSTGSGIKCQWQISTDGGASWKKVTVEGDLSPQGNVYNTVALTVQATAAKSGYLFRCVITDQYGNTVISDIATLSVR